MYEFKRSLTALLGILTLVAIATIAFPHVGRSANGPTNNAPTTQTQNVNVVNTPTVSAQQSGPWSVGINGTPSVNVENTPSVNAQQTGPWTVSIAGTPTVTLDDTSAVKVSATTTVVADVEKITPQGAVATFGPFDVSAYKQIRVAAQTGACAQQEIQVVTYFPGGGSNFAPIADDNFDNCRFTRTYDLPGESIKVAVLPNVAEDTDVRLVIWGRTN